MIHRNQRELHNINVQRQRVADLGRRIDRMNASYSFGRIFITPKLRRKATGLARKYKFAQAELKRLEGGLARRITRKIMARLEVLKG
jgi:hypothetical protein